MHTLLRCEVVYIHAVANPGGATGAIPINDSLKEAVPINDYKLINEPFVSLQYKIISSFKCINIYTFI